MKYFTLFTLVLQTMICNTLHSQGISAIEWERSFGGSADDAAYSVQQTFDNGFVVAGSSSSDSNEVTGNHGGTDYWIMKTGPSGILQWQKSLGGSGEDGLYHVTVRQSADGGFIIAGTSDSDDGDVSGNHGGSDFWIVKLDATGNISWEKNYGGSGDDLAYSIIQTANGNYVVAGLSDSNDGDLSGNHGDADCWIIEIDASGNLLWQRSVGGSDYERAYSIQEIPGGFILAGSSYSEDGDVSGNHGGSDYWIAALDGSGNLLWQKTLGGSGNEYATSIQPASDGGFIIGGTTLSDDGDVTVNHGNSDYWIVKINAVGTITWQKTLGGTDDEVAYSVSQVADGSYIVAGMASSSDGDVTGNHGYYDYWIVKLAEDGNLIWEKSIGGTSADLAYSIEQTTDDGFIVAGSSDSGGGDVSANHGGRDYWIVKLSADSTTSIFPIKHKMISVYPNPVQSQLIITDVASPERLTVFIFDLSGREIQLPVTFQENKSVINTFSLPDGIYTVRIMDNLTGNSEVGKFVKEGR